jgi:hypothetical protein
MRDLNLSVIARRPVRRIRMSRGLVVAAALVLLAGLVGGPLPMASATPSDRSSDAKVISDWNAIALSTLAGDTTKAPQESLLYVGFVQAAVYNAVVGIDGRYEPYRFHAHAPRHASAQAAAAAAAHRVLTTSLDAAYATSLAAIPDGPAKTDGIAFGELAADRLIQQRVGDGRNAPITFTQPPAPGVWRPTPPAFASMAVPWMGFVTPLLLRSGAQFGLP